MDKILISVEDLLGADVDAFCTHLTQATCAHLLARIANPQITFQKSLNLFENFLNDPKNAQIRRDCYGTNHLNVRQILRQGAYNLECKSFGGMYSIDINQNILVPGTFIPIRKICSLVDVGNFELKGTHLFSDCYKEIEDNAGKILDQFLLGVSYVRSII